MPSVTSGVTGHSEATTTAIVAVTITVIVVFSLLAAALVKLQAHRASAVWTNAASSKKDLQETWLKVAMIAHGYSIVALRQKDVLT
jgi:hypothetical protein